jgi:hypothetical protein
MTVKIDEAKPSSLTGVVVEKIDRVSQMLRQEAVT